MTRLRVACAAVLIFATALLVASLATAGADHTAFGRPLGADFAEFYLAGRALNRHDGQHLYDQARQDAAYHRLFPRSPRSSSLPYLYPPMVALAFRPLAHLSYRMAFSVWVALSAGLYVLALTALRPLIRLPAEGLRTSLLLGLAFEPFVFETLQGGQLSAIAAAAAAFGILADRRNRPFASGLAFGCCIYKPTLLIFIIPMLVAGRRWRTLAGLATTTGAAALLSVAAAGWSVARSYPRVLVDFSKATTGNASFRIPLWKYVDLNSFVRALTGRPAAGDAVVAVAAVGAVAVLWRSWWRWGQCDADRRLSLWAATLTLTVVVNIYVAVYDALLIWLSLLLTSAFLAGGGTPGLEHRSRRARTRASGLFAASTAAYGLFWITQPIAKATSLQLVTLALAALAVLQVQTATRLPSVSPSPGGAQPLR